MMEIIKLKAPLRLRLSTSPAHTILCHQPEVPVGTEHYHTDITSTNIRG